MFQSTHSFRNLTIPFSLLFVAATGGFSQVNSPSYEDALAQANELLRQHGIDPHGEDHGSGDSANAADAFVPLTLDQIIEDEDVWPGTIELTDVVSFSNGLNLETGTAISFSGFGEDKSVYLNYQNNNLFLPSDLTNIVDAANKVASGEAKHDGYEGRFVEQLAGRALTDVGSSSRPIAKDELAGSDLYLMYMSSQACGWCKLFTPTFSKAVDKIKAANPGALTVIHASVDRSQQDFVKKYQSIGADAAIKPGDRYYIDAYSNAHPGVRQIAQPSVMLVNANGRVIDSAMRNNRDTRALESFLKRLSKHAENRESLRPAWMSKTFVPEVQATPEAPPSANLALLLSPPQAVSDSSLAGPEPFARKIIDGTESPGLVIYDRKTTGSRLPAFTIQRWTDSESGKVEYIFAFRQVLGETVTSSRPIMRRWIETRSSNLAELQLRVDALKGLREKFLEWRQTAIDNSVTDFQKSIVSLEESVAFSPNTLPAFSLPGQKQKRELDVQFIVGSSADRATLRAGNFTWMPNEIDAFVRMVPHLDRLISGIEYEATRLSRSKEEERQKAKDVDALFN